MASKSIRHVREQRILTAILVVALCAIYITYALTEPIAAIAPSTSYHFSRKATPATIAWPGYGTSAIGAVGYGVLDTQGSDQPIPTASTIKVLTALAVLSQKPLAPHEDGPFITITQADVDSYHNFIGQNGSVVGVALGEQLSEYDALEALLLPSANNIADTLARWAFGSIDSFNTYANQYAHELGMVNTTVTDPSGFDPTTVSTPHDLVLLGEAAMANSVVSEIANKSSAIIPIQGVITNVNFLLGQDGIVGLKTGNSDQNPGSFLAAAKHNIGGQDITVISAIMDGPDLWTAVHDSLALLNSATNGFTAVTLSDSLAMGNYKAPWQSSATIASVNNQTVVLWGSSTATGTVSLRNVAAPAKSGVQVGSLTITSRNMAKPIVVPLVLQGSINGPDIVWRLSHPQ